ncbi:MAG TPA: type VI secretion system protein TssA [Steroidobacteraceae bacterium]|jgi:type VI secretion system protein ImpA|nr:type VI secretion system protein TssA [Steroidobacteraceae bacterium]
MTVESEIEELKRPVSQEEPCGKDLEDTQLLASFDGFHVFGQGMPLGEETDWREIKTHAMEAIRQSKDIRLLSHYAAAALRVDGWPGLYAGINVCADWIKNHWAQVFPRVDDDAIMRKNALNYLSDRMAILDAVRRTPVVEHRQMGRISLRDVDLAKGQLPPGESDTAPATEAQVAAVFAATATEELTVSRDRARGALVDLRSIDGAMRESGGTSASPDFDPLISLLMRVDKLMQGELTVRGMGEAPGEADGGKEGASDGAAPGAGGGIKTRKDAERALDAIAAFFRQAEPSSPVPLFIERAKRLIGKDFLEVLADVAPDGVATARNAGGLT